MWAPFTYMHAIIAVSAALNAFGLVRCCRQDLKEVTKESAQRAQRAEQLEGRLRKTDNKLSAAKKEMADAAETVRNRTAFGLFSPSRPPGRSGGGG